MADPSVTRLGLHLRSGDEMRRIGIGLLSGAGGYLSGAIAGYLLVWTFSGNVHDRDVEAAMTGAFIIGPAAAVVALALGFVRGGRRFGPTHRAPRGGRG